MMWKVVFLLSLIVYTPLDGRKSGGSGGGGRGVSQGRQAGPQGGGMGGHPGGGFQPNGGGFQQQRPGGFGGQQPHYPPPGGFGGQQGGHFGGGGFGGRSNFGSGNGLGSMSRGTVFKTALAGAALGAVGGLVTYQLGKAVLNSFDRPFHHDNRNYYWDQQYYKGQPGQMMCSMPLQQLIGSVPTTTQAPPSADGSTPAPSTATPTPDQLLSQVVFPNGTRPKEIVWSCRQGAEVCCGTECCPAPQGSPGSAASHSGHSFGGIILGILLVLLLMCCCCGLIAYKFCRSAFDFIMPSSSNQQNQNTYYDDSKYGSGDNNYGQQQQYGQVGYSQPQQSYPMQPYPQQQQGYQPPQQYPSYPPPPVKY